MKQLMTARQALGCYLAPGNHGEEFVLKHFPKRYTFVLARVQADKHDKTLMITMRFVEADADDGKGADAVTVLMACADEMNEELKRYPTYLHHLTGIDEYGNLVMLFKHSTMSRESLRTYMARLGVE